jgi:hypothetical protein
MPQAAQKPLRSSVKATLQKENSSSHRPKPTGHSASATELPFVTIVLFSLDPPLCDICVRSSALESSSLLLHAPMCPQVSSSFVLDLAIPTLHAQLVSTLATPAQSSAHNIISPSRSLDQASANTIKPNQTTTNSSELKRESHHHHNHHHPPLLALNHRWKLPPSSKTDTQHLEKKEESQKAGSAKPRSQQSAQSHQKGEGGFTWFHPCRVESPRSGT